MDWYCINFLYPSAFNRFGEVMFPNVGILSISTLEYYDVKKLYRFFDKEGIYLTIEMYNPHQWVCNISLANGVVIGTKNESKKTREEIEIDGFFECFKLLDKKLNHE
jgi:hypothetical protein